MSDINEMRAERARLDREIRAAEDDALSTFNFNLDRLSDAVYRYARENSIGWADSSRKNWVTLVLNGSVTVKFGERDDSYGQGGLTVVSGSMTTEFDPLPSAEDLIALIAFLLSQEGTGAGA